jgi:hypothetical protein
MFSYATGKRAVLCALVCAITGLIGGRLSLAGKPGGGGSTGGGTIYFTSNFTQSSMNSDGTGKTELPVGVFGDPSRVLHGGHRWFLQSRRSPDETYPDGLARWEAFAVRDDGNESITVQLTNDPELDFTGAVCWAPGETSGFGMIAGLARRFIFDGTSWVVDPSSIGLYATTVLFDANGNVMGTDGPPQFLVSLGIAPFDYADAYNQDFSWSPDLAKIVFSNHDRSELRVLRVTTGQFQTIASSASPFHARWSPGGNSIVFGNGYGSIETILPNGTGRKELIRWGASYGYWNPEWSPTGSYLVYERQPHGDPYEADVFRMTSAGGGKTNMTADLTGTNKVGVWR